MRTILCIIIGALVLSALQGIYIMFCYSCYKTQVELTFCYNLMLTDHSNKNEKAADTSFSHSIIIFLRCDWVVFST